MNVHYIWIGPPKDNNQDVKGPIEMRSEFGPECQIYFWCLDAMTTRFERKLATVNRITHGITVRSIEGALRSAGGRAFRWLYWYGDKEDWAVAQMLRVVQISTGEGSTVRDYVNAKNAFAYFLLYTWGGYVMDTNVMPDDIGRARLPEYDHFMSPLIGTKETNIIGHDRIIGNWLPRWRGGGRGGMCLASTVMSELRGNRIFRDPKQLRDDAASQQTLPNPECWMLYSPQYNSTAWRALEAFLCSWERLLVIRARFQRGEEVAETYHACCGNAVIDALVHAVTHGDDGRCLRLDPRHCWTAEKVGETPKIKALRIKKIYQNTHKLQNVQW